MLTYFSCYMPIHDVAPSAVTIAVATDAMICTINLSVSLLVITLMFVLPTDYTNYTDCHLEHLPPLCHFESLYSKGVLSARRLKNLLKKDGLGKSISSDI